MFYEIIFKNIKIFFKMTFRNNSTLDVVPPPSSQTGLQQKTPPSGYICHRCQVPGTFNFGLYLKNVSKKFKKQFLKRVFFCKVKACFRISIVTFSHLNFL